MYKKRCVLSNCSTNSNKKGQVTVFIIIGILILLALVLVIALREQIFRPTPGELTPVEKGPVETLISSCILQLGNEALQRIGAQAGYVEVPAEILNDGSKGIKLSPHNTLPYWAYGENTNIPSLQEIKVEIDGYIEQNLRGCLFDLQAFQDSFDIIEKSGITSDTEIGENKIDFNVLWELEVRDKDGLVISELRNHIADSPIKLKKLYDTANRIIEFELRDLKLEDLTQDLLALEHQDVPLAGFEVSCKEKTWEIEKTKQSLKDLLRVNLRELKVTGTEYVDFPDELSYYQNHYIWNLGENFAVQDVAVGFNFDNDAPFQFDVTPRSGAYLRSGTVGTDNPLTSVFCLQSWKFIYDLVFPVTVTLEDLTTGYTFDIAFTVHIENNFPDRSGVPSGNGNFYTATENDETFCARTSIPMTVNTYELVENNGTGIYNREPLDNADITFSCLRYTCDVGRTEYNYFQRGDVAFTSDFYPYCVGGIIRAEKPGYKESWQRVVTQPNNEIDLNLVPVLEIPINNIKVVKHRFNPDNPTNIGSAQQLGREEIALINLKYGDNPLVPSTPAHEINILKANSLDQRVQAEETAQFLAKADFEYEVEINVLDNEQLVGGYVGNWTLPWQDLISGNEITFHIISLEGASENEQFELFLALSQFSQYAPQPEIN